MKTAVTIAKSRINDRNSLDTRRIVEDMLEATGFEGDFTLDIVTKQTGDNKNVGSVQLKRGHVSGIEVVVQHGNRDTCYLCTLVWEGHTQTAFLFDLSRRLGEKKTFWRSVPVVTSGGEKKGEMVPVVASTGVAQAAPEGKAPGKLSKDEVMAFIILMALGETWFSFGNVWSSIFVPRGLTTKKPVAQRVLKWLVDKNYLERKGSRRWTRYHISSLGKETQKGGGGAVQRTVPPALPTNDADLNPAMIEGLRLRSEEFSAAHVRVRQANDRIADLSRREESLAAELRGIASEKSALLRDKAAYEALMSSPDYKRDYERYAALKRKS